MTNNNGTDKTKLLSHPVLSKVLASICALLWGSAFPLVKISYDAFQIESGDMPSKLMLSGCRFLIGGIVLAVIFIILQRGKRVIPEKKEWKIIFIIGMIQTFLQSMCFYVGVGNTEASKASVLNTFGIFFTVFLAHFLFKNDRINQKKVIGCILGICGIIIINFAKTGFSITFRLTGEGAVMGAATCFALGTTLSKLWNKEIDGIKLTTFQSLVGSLMLIIVGGCLGGKLSVISFSGVMLLLYLGLSTVFANCIWLYLIQNNPISKITVFNFLIPIFGTLLSAIILSEDVVGVINIAGVLLASSGIFVVNYQAKKE